MVNKPSCLHGIVIGYGHRKPNLLRCLQSIRASGFKSEIVVVDMYDDQLNPTDFDIQYFALKAGLSEVFRKSRCLNYGIQRASCKYVSIVDCDMIISPGWHEEIMSLLHPTHVVTTPVVMHSKDWTNSFLNGYIDRKAFIRGDGKFSRFGRSQITLLREHLLRRPYRNVYHGWGAEDSEMNLQLSKSLIIEDLHKSLAHHHLFHHRSTQNDFYKKSYINRNRRIYSQVRSAIKPRMGIYVAAYNSSATLKTHLDRIARYTEMEFDYYIADNSTDSSEKRYFHEIVSQHPFATVIESPSPKHGDTLQYMVESTANEIIVLYDVDCFPLKTWDKWSLERLHSKDVVGILSYVASREIDYHLHPSFMIFRRSLLTDNGLDLRSGQIARSSQGRVKSLDPAGKITAFLQSIGCFNSRHIEALLPSEVEVAFQEPFEWDGKKNLRRGFGVTYENMIFHFWYSRHFRNLDPIYDDEKQLVVDSPSIKGILKKYTEPKFSDNGLNTKNKIINPKSYGISARNLILNESAATHLEVFRSPNQNESVIIDLFMLTFERADYTLMTLNSLREVDCGLDWESVRFTIWDNFSQDPTVKEVRRFMKEHPGVVDRLILAKRNHHVVGGMQHYLKSYLRDAKYVGKIDNDSLFNKDWLKRMVDALDDFRGLGVVGAQEYAGQGKNGQKKATDGGVGYYPARFVGGRFLARPEILQKFLSERSHYTSWTNFQKKFLGQWEIGWCFPEAIIEHVGDWRFQHPEAIKSDEYIDYFIKTGRENRIRPYLRMIKNTSK